MKNSACTTSIWRSSPTTARTCRLFTSTCSRTRCIPANAPESGGAARKVRCIRSYVRCARSSRRCSRSPPRKRGNTFRRRCATKPLRSSIWRCRAAASAGRTKWPSSRCGRASSECAASSRRWKGCATISCRRTSTPRLRWNRHFAPSATTCARRSSFPPSRSWSIPRSRPKPSRALSCFPPLVKNVRAVGRPCRSAAIANTRCSALPARRSSARSSVSNPRMAVAANFPSLEDVRAARKRIAPYVEVTPTFARDGVAYKLEFLQHTGSFKVRGAFNAALQLTQEERSRGVVAMSGGNHGLAVAYVGRVLGISATVVMPKTTPQFVVDRASADGALVELTDTISAAFTRVDELVREGQMLLHPFDDLRVIAGQGTIVLEMLEQLPDLMTLVASVGGGGLIGGI